MHIKESLNTPIAASYDVIVAGGGVGGISAAIAAARGGARTLLIERSFMLGGLATAGLITIYLPLCDGMGRQVSFGIAEELLRLSIKHGAEGRMPRNWLYGEGERNKSTERFMVQYNAQLFAILAEKLLLSLGVSILYGTSVCSVAKEKDRIAYIITENKSGRLAYGAKSVVDATGDADIAYMAGAPCETFRQGNILAGWYYSVGKDGYKLRPLGASDTPEEEKSEKGAPMLLSQRRFSGLNGDEISEYTALSHGATLDDILKRKEDDPELLPVTISTVPQLRMTRHITGEYTLSHKEEHTYFDDSVGMVSDWKKRGPVYEVPFRTLYSASVKNLITAGRCTSVYETMWDIMRVIPCCAVTGEAAGTAAAMTDDFTKLDPRQLQKKLRASGVVIHEKDL